MRKDGMSDFVKITGCEYVCDVPEELGKVTGLEQRNGRDNERR
jgi:hypothetical protein